MSDEVIITDDTFGDIEPADEYDPTAEPDPYAVAWRLHEIVGYLDPTVADWLDLDPPGRDELVAMAQQLLDETHTDLDDDRLARAVHTVRHVIDPKVPDWDALSDEEHEVASALIHALIVWLHNEGAV